MECDICGKHASPSEGLHCPTCARSAIYSLRVEHAATLLDKESLGKRVEAAISGTTAGSSDIITLGGMLVDTSEAAKTTQYERTLAELDESRDRINNIAEKAEALKREMELQRRRIAERKKDAARRQSDGDSAKVGLAGRDAKQLEEVQKLINKTHLRWEKYHRDTVRARSYLCREAAALAGLRTRKIRREEGGARYFWSVGGNEVPDLRSLNAADPTELTAAFGNLANLLVRVSTYLSIRLPAEITLPHKDYPLATIFPPDASYKARDVPFPGSTVSLSGHNSPSRTIQRKLPNPKPLWVDKPLPQLFKDETAVFMRFVQGACYLAWDVAWLCRSQSSTVPLDSFEDVCNMGKNLHQLLVSDQKRKTSRRDSSDKTATPSPAPASNSSTTASAAPSMVSLGNLSHGTSHSHLGGPEGGQYMREWFLKSPTELILKVRAQLVAELQGAEWEMIDEEGDFGEEEAPDIISTTATISEEPTVRRGSEANGSLRGGGGDADDGRARGVSGWTKLKSRSGELI